MNTFLLSKVWSTVSVKVQVARLNGQGTREPVSVITEVQARTYSDVMCYHFGLSVSCVWIPGDKGRERP